MLALNNVLHWIVRDVDQDKPIVEGSTQTETPFKLVAKADDTIPEWLNVDISTIESWRGKAAVSETADRNVTLVESVIAKQATSPMDVGNFWIQLSITSMCERDLHYYIGCSVCGRKVTNNAGDKIDCATCTNKPTVAVERLLINAQVFDKSGTVEIVAFTQEAKLLFWNES